MKKNKYISPAIEQILLDMNTHLLDWSADKVPGGGGNRPEAKQNDLYSDALEDEDDDEINEIPHYNVWDD